MGILARLLGRPETRATGGSYTDAFTSALVQVASGDATADPGGLAALETAAGMFSRAFSSAEVEGSDAARAALTPSVLGLIGRSLIRRGECLFLIDVTENGVRLRPAGYWDIRGFGPEEEWQYRMDVFGPSGSRSYYRPGAGVVHVRLAIDAARPWRGISPLSWARSTATLAANLENRLSEEAGGAVAHVLPMPSAEADAGDEDGGKPLKQLREDVAAARGRTVFVETNAAGHGEGRAAAPARDWVPSRIGADPPATLAGLRNDASTWILNACGIPPSLAAVNSDGTAQRESYRRWSMGAVGPISKVVEEELSLKFGAPVSLSFDRLMSGDITGRARAFQSLVGAGMDPGKAAGLAGLMEAE